LARVATVSPPPKLKMPKIPDKPTDQDFEEAVLRMHTSAPRGNEGWNRWWREGPGAHARSQPMSAAAGRRIFDSSRRSTTWEKTAAIPIFMQMMAHGTGRKGCWRGEWTRSNASSVSPGQTRHGNRSAGGSLRNEMTKLGLALRDVNSLAALSR
jgi:hypothetical protein